MKRYKSDLYFLENYWKDAKEIADNVSHIPEGGEFETLNYQLSNEQQ